MREVGVRRQHPEARPPERAHPGDAGFDLHATEAVTVPPGGRAAVPCGFAMALPEGTAGLVLPRSGLALRSGVTVLTAPGLIDSGYRGEVMAILVNHDPDDAFTVSPGDRIADGRDVSWIWDIDLEGGLDAAAGVVCTGTRAADLAVRLRYADLAADSIDIRTPPEAAFDAAVRDAPPGGRVYVLATYTAMLDLHRVLAERGLTRSFWEEAQ
ncbi:MAG: dUTP diphosphatase [Actinomycetota bacterium]